VKTWFSIQAKADNAAEISIFDEIGMWGVTAKDFIAALKEHKGKAINLSINSPGGSVFDALAIYNALRQHGGEITTKTMGIAASAASLIFMAGDKRLMPENTFLMIHNPMTLAMGNADEMREVADILDKIAASLISTYVSRSGLPEEEVKALLDNETWLNAADAVSKGFASEMIAEFKAAASFDLGRLPENVKAVFVAKEDGGDGEPDVETAKEWLQEAIDLHEKHMNGTEPTTGPDGEKSQHLMMDQMQNSMDAMKGKKPGKPMKMQNDPAPTATLADQIAAAASAAGMSDHVAVFLLDKSITDEAAAKAAIAQAREINALCAAAKLPDMAAKLIRDKASIEQARASLFDALAEADQSARTDQHQRTDKPKATGKEVWAKVIPLITNRQTKE
jgi:ATP-dependent Clp protease protease subunit